MSKRTVPSSLPNYVKHHLAGFLMSPHLLIEAKPPGEGTETPFQLPQPFPGLAPRTEPVVSPLCLTECSGGAQRTALSSTEATHVGRDRRALIEEIRTPFRPGADYLRPSCVCGHCAVPHDTQDRVTT